MELKIGDKFVTSNKYIRANYNGRYNYLLGKILTVGRKEEGEYIDLEYGLYWSNNEIDLEETKKLNKIKMTIGEDRIVECGEHKVRWIYGKDYLEIDNSSMFEIENSKYETVISLSFSGSENLKQQIEIANLILYKLGLNVELVEDDLSCKLKELYAEQERILNKIDTLRHSFTTKLIDELTDNMNDIESELEKLRRLVK